MEYSTVILSIGSNCGDRRANVSQSLAWLSTQEGVSIIQISDIYETPELHGVGNPYINGVVKINTLLGYDALQNRCKDYEISTGRDNECRAKGMVPIDIDIVIWNNEILRPKDYSCEFFQIGYDQIADGLHIS